MANSLESDQRYSRTFQVGDNVIHSVEEIRSVQGKVIETSRSGLVSVNVESIIFASEKYKHVTVSRYYWGNKPIDIFFDNDPRLRKIDHQLPLLAILNF